MRVLYVEDNEVNQALVARVMRARQNKVLFCEEGEKALEILADDSDIDLVLLDIELAGVMSGLDVIRTLRARNDRRPVVAITAYAMMGDRERILEAGCDQYLPKPLVIPDLLKLLDHYDAVIAEQAAQPAAPAAPAPVKTVAPGVQAAPVEKSAQVETSAPVHSAPAAVVPAPSGDGTSATAVTPAPANGQTVPAVQAAPVESAKPEVTAPAPSPAPSVPSPVPTPVKNMSPVTAPPVDSALVEPVEDKQHEQG